MTNFLTRRNRQEPTATATPAETRQEAFANAVAAFRQATGKAEARMIPVPLRRHRRSRSLSFSSG